VAAAIPERTRDGLVRRNLVLLMGAQAALLASSAVWFSLSVVAIVDLTGRELWSGVFLAAFNLFAAAAALLTGRLMDRSGRREGLVVGHVLLGLGGALGGVAVWQESTAGLFLAAAVFGSGLGASLLGRAAAADMVEPERRGRVVGTVVAAGTVGAIAGAPLVAAVERLTGSEVLPWLMIPVFQLAGVVTVALLRPDPKTLALDAPGPAISGRARSLGSLLALAPIRAAILAIGIAHTAMVAVMGVTPVAIDGQGGGPLAIAIVISVHIAGMYALGPFIGASLDRFGRRPGLLLGCTLSAAGAVAGSISHDVALIAIGMTLVGLGWAFCYLGATAVIADLTTSEERGTTLGFTDLFTSGAAAIGALAGGFVLESAGLGLVGAVMAGLMVPVVLLVLPLREPAPGRWTAAIPAAGEAS